MRFYVRFVEGTDDVLAQVALRGSGARAIVYGDDRRVNSFFTTDMAFRWADDILRSRGYHLHEDADA